jgi:NAD-dependent DNA ligase
VKDPASLYYLTKADLLKRGLREQKAANLLEARPGQRRPRAPSWPRSDSGVSAASRAGALLAPVPPRWMTGPPAGRIAGDGVGQSARSRRITSKARFSHGHNQALNEKLRKIGVRWRRKSKRRQRNAQLAPFAVLTIVNTGPLAVRAKNPGRGLWRAAAKSAVPSSKNQLPLAEQTPCSKDTRAPGVGRSHFR